MSDTTLLTGDGQGNTGAAPTTQAVDGQQPAAPAADNTPPADKPADANGTQPNADGQQPPADGKAADGQGDANKDEKKPERNALHGAPAEGTDYGDFTAEEGVEYAPELVNEAKTLARELDLSQAGAERLNKAAHDMAKTMGEAQVNRLQEARQEWQEASKADPTFGGVKLQENLAVAAKAREAFGDDELKQVLNASGLGDHPAVIRAFFKVGKAMSEDSMVVGKPAPTDTRSRAERIYPNQQPQK